MFDILHSGIAAHDLALAVPRIAAGLFFVISGAHKLFCKQRHAGLVQTLTADKVPAVWFMQWWVPGWEFAGGAALTVGLLSVPAAAVLTIIMLVATYAEASARVAAYQPLDFADKVDDYLYLPEVVYIILLAVTLLAGPGAFSLDHLLF